MIILNSVSSGIISIFDNIHDMAPVEWDRFKESSFLVTGATGLIGFNLVLALVSYARQSLGGITIYILVRNADKARRRFEDVLLPDDPVVFLEGDVRNPIPLEDSVDFVIHAASRTDSAGFVSEPVSVIKTTVDGTSNILEFSRTHKVKKMIYLSSMEVYGSHSSEELISEQYCGDVDPLQIRSCYPEAKRMAEALCCAYHSQYGVPVSIARLAQVFGPGVSSDDSRVFVYFAKCALEGLPVRLATTGESTRMYLSSIDAVLALLVMLTESNDGEAYNLANKETYCSIKDLARVAFETLSGKDATIIVDPPEDVSKYPPTHHLKLDTHKIESLGWRPLFGLKDMFSLMIKCM